MKKSMIITGIILFGVFLISFLFNSVSAHKPGTDPKPIPADVMNIAKNSCVHCHTEPGKAMAMMHLNLSNWDKFSAEKQADKAKDMCKMVSKGKMPPKSFKEEHADGVPSKTEVNTICKWAGSLQEKKK